MKTVIAATMFAALVIPLGVSVSAEEGGCLKYGVGGAVAGHFAGRHTMRGAAIGCGIGAEKRHRAREEERAQERAYQQGLRDRGDRDGYDSRR